MKPKAAQPGRSRPHSPVATRPWRARAAFAFALSLALALLVMAVYWPVHHYAFINLDDPAHVWDNPHIRDGLTWHGIQWAFGLNHWLWHPLTFVSHMIDCELFSLDAGGHHLTNAVLHALNAMLVLLVLRSMTGSLWRSALVAALFALHPLRVESVAWVTERKDVLSMFFGVLALGAYTGYARRPGALRYLLVMLLLALSLMAKAMLVTLPLLLLVLDYWPLRRFGELPSPSPGKGGSRSESGESRAHEVPHARVAQQAPDQSGPPPSLPPEGGEGARRLGFARLVLEKLPLLALALGASVMTMLAGRANEAVVSAEMLPFSARLANAAVACGRYIETMFWPHDLAVFYPHPGRWPTGLVGGAAALLVAVTLLALWQARRRPYLIVGWLWFLGTLVPVLGLVQSGMQARADRFTYFPMIGLCIMLTWALGAWAKNARWRIATASAAAIAAALALTLATRAQLPYWKDSITLAQRTIAVTPPSPTAHFTLAGAYELAGRTDDAITHYRKAIELGSTQPQAWYNLGAHLRRKGELAQTIELYESALQRFPDAFQILNDLGVIRIEQGDEPQATTLFERALAANGRYVPALLNLAGAHARAGLEQEALPLLERAISLEPRNIDAHVSAGAVLAQLGRSHDAAQHFERALAIDPQHGEAHAHLAAVLAAQGKLGDAVTHFEKRLQFGPDSAEIRHRLAVVLASMNNTEAAIAQARQAVTLDPKHAAAGLHLAMLLESVGDWRGAAVQYEALHRHTAPTAAALHAHGRALLNLKRYDEAVAQLDAALRLKPDDHMIRADLERARAAVRP